MRILHVVRQFKPGIGGLEDYLANLSRQQTLAGHSVKIVTLNRLYTTPSQRLPTTESIAGCEVSRIGYCGSNRYPLAPAALLHFRDCDIVHIHGIDFFFDFAAWTHILHLRPMVASTHGAFFHTPYMARAKKLYFNSITRVSARAYGAILASSVPDQTLFNAIAPDRVCLVENGIDTDKFAGSGSPVLRKHIVTVGRFAAHKRLDRLFSLLAALRRADGEWRLTIVGTPADVSREQLHRRAAALDLASSVTVVENATDQDIACIFETASFFASASDYEGFGIAAVEGLSAGLVPLLNDIPAFRRLQERAGIGIVTDFADPARVAGQLLAALPEFTARYQTLRAVAQQAAAAYAWPVVARSIQAIYDQVLGTNQRPIFGVPVAVATSRAAIARLDSSADAGKTTRIAFLNAHGANIARKNRQFLSSLRKCIVLNDGVGLDIASLWLYGSRFPDNLNGTDFTIDYLRRTTQSYRIFLLGARRRVVIQAAVRLSARVGRHRIVGYHDGYFGARSFPDVAAEIRQSGANMLLVALGNPHQELLIAEHLEETGCKVAFGVGALFDFVSGSIPRAPLWMRRCRLEWLFRLALEPRRLWRRYVIGNALFLAGLISAKAATGRLDGVARAPVRRRHFGYSP
ncbi:MAG: WecB/TagA/CpsF family glycosyltransferase [Alphaproteobacteria bacterium]|nr:WecB/TagA/CpsF family glycosyltransferase [Alphaproteobacteria bacterium]